MIQGPPPSESNAFARSLRGKAPTNQRARFVLGVALSLMLAACVTLALFFLGGLVVRGVRHGDYWALGAAVAVTLMTIAMARGRRRS